MTTFTYTRDIPDAPHSPSTDQPDMKINTNSADDLINQDHFSFNLTDGGLHRQVRLPIRGGGTGTIPPGLVPGEGTLYTKTVTSEGINTETGLFYSPDASSNQYQITRTITGKFTKFGANVAYGTPLAGFTQEGGWTFLPGGLLLQYGFYGQAGATGTSGTIEFPVTFTVDPFSVQVSLYRTSGSQTLTINSNFPPTTTQFRFLTSTAGSDGVYWMAIGM